MGVALVAFLGVASSAHARTCCNNTPKQCEAFSMCFDDGFCYDANNMCNISTQGTCKWLDCNREG